MSKEKVCHYKVAETRRRRARDSRLFWGRLSFIWRFGMQLSCQSFIDKFGEIRAPKIVSNVRKLLRIHVKNPVRHSCTSPL